MGSQIGGMDNVKIYVLNLMMAIGYPVDFVTLNDALRQTDYVDYFDFANAFNKMVDDGLIVQTEVEHEGRPCYLVTGKGACVVDAMRSNILSVALEDSEVAAMRYLDFQRRGVKISCRIELCREGGCHIICSVTEKEKTLVSLTLWVEDVYTARRMEKQFRDHPENTYRAVRALLSGNINYLFDKK